MNVDFAFCRVCYVSSSVANLSSLFDESGKNARKFQVIAGVDIFKDQGKHDALICEYCTVDLKRSFWVRERMRNIEGFHFSKKRKAYEDEQGERQESSAKRSVELEAIEEVQQQLKKKEAPIQNKPTFSHDDKIKKVFQCPVCELKLATRFSLANHNNSVHLKITRFNCSMCPKKFYYKNHLIMHLNKHQ